MKRKKIVAIVVVTLGLMLCLAKVNRAAPMGTAFTYQGRLLDANGPADGVYDLQFKLFDDPNINIGEQLGSTININDLDVIDGYFTVELDFGSDAFDGNEVWLETTVAHADGSDPCTLSPRRVLTPTPYAIYARAAGGDNDWMVVGNDMYAIPSGNVGIGTTSPTEALTIADGGKLRISSAGNGKYLRLFHDDTDCKIVGNSGHIYVVPPVSKSLYVKTVDPGLGYGTAQTAIDAHVNHGGDGYGTIKAVNAKAWTNAWSGSNNADLYGLYSHAENVRTGGSGTFNSYGVYGKATATTNGTTTTYGIYGTASGGDTNWAGYFDDGYVYIKDKVGIGTTSPVYKLDVDGGSSSAVRGESSDGTGVYGWHSATTMTSPGVHGVSSSTSSYATGVVGEITSTSPGIWSAGVRGINNGTSDSGIGVWGSQDGGGWGVYGSSSNGRGVYGDNTSSGNYGYLGGGSNGVYGQGTDGVYGYGSNNGVYGYNSNSSNSGSLATTISGVSGSGDYYGVVGNSSRNGLNYGGDFTAAGSQGYGVRGQATNTGDYYNYGGWFKANGGSSTGVYGWGNSYDFYAAGPGTNYGSSSSVRWKCDVRAIDEPLRKVLCLRGVYFNWDRQHGGEHDVGMIAEEVGEVLPEIVQYEKDGIYASGMDYSKLTPLLVEAIKALKVEVNELQRQNAEKDGVIDTLKHQYDKLEGRLDAMEDSIVKIAVQIKGDPK